MTFDELIEAYLTDLRSRHRTARFSLLEGQGLRRFQSYCGVRHLEQVQLEHIVRYSQSLRECGYKDITRYYMVNIVRRALKWATYRGYLLQNPAQSWHPRHPPLASFRKIPTEEQMKALLDVPRLDCPKQQRDAVLLEFLYGTGLRVQECASTTLMDLDLSQRILIVHGKGGKVRHQPLGPRLTARLETYLQDVRPKLQPQKENITALFLNDGGGHLKAHSIAERLRSYSLKIGSTIFSVHSIRHAFATHLLLAGTPLWAVQKLLGHDHVSSTALYTRLLPLDVQSELMRTHPRAKSRRRSQGEPPTSSK